MNSTVDHDELEAALRRCGSTWDASQVHGLLCSRLAADGPAAGTPWLHQVLAEVSPDNALRGECESLLDALFGESYRQLAERQSEFRPLLPADDESAGRRAESLAHWCEGFLHGLVTERRDPRLRERLAAEPLADIIRDLLELTRAEVDDDVPAETNEEAFAELVEYVRVAAQVSYEELAELREPPVSNDDDGSHE